MQTPNDPPAPTPSGGSDTVALSAEEHLRSRIEAARSIGRVSATVSIADVDEILSALLAARRGEEEEAWSAYRRGYLDGVAYQPPEGSRDTFETLSAVADARASQHVKGRRRAALAATPERETATATQEGT